MSSANPSKTNQWLYHAFFICLVFLGIMGCSQQKKSDDGVSFYKVGHRGTRGLMPENTIPAMEKGLEIGANTIEFDVHITKDDKVIVYHDASVNPSYTSLPGKEITKANRKEYTFYQMPYEQIRRFDVGKNKDGFPDQQQIDTSIPLLSALIDSVESFTQNNHMDPAYYLLEIKSGASTDGREQPAPGEYVTLLMDVLKPRIESLGDRLIVQSFDMRPLQVIHNKYPDITLGFLTGNKNKGFDAQLDSLGFTPAFYNPYYKLVTPELLKACHGKGIKVVPWTVNEKEDIYQLTEMGVDGIITDFPNRL